MNAAEQARQKRYRYMTETPVPKLISTLALPTIISMLVTGLYNTADTYFVGRISTQATAAVGIVFPAMSLIQALGFFCGQGSGTYVSRKLGSGEMKEANEMAATGFFLALIIGAFVSIAGLIFLDPLARILGATPSTLADTRAYMRIILCGAPFMMSQLVINNQLRFQGSAAYAMVGLVSGALVNIGLDPLFMFGLHMGVTGAAAATVLSQLLSFCILLIGSYRGPNIHIHINNVRFNAHYLKQIANGGSPSLARQGLSSISSVILNTTAGALGGDAAIAGMSVVTRVMMLAFSALIGFGQGFQPVCAFNYGAKKYERVREGFWFCVRYGTAFLLLLAIPGVLFSPRIVEFFRDDPDVVAVGSVALRFIACAFPLNAFTTMSNMCLQSMGKGARATLLASGRSGLFMIPLLLILSRIFGLRGVEMAQAGSDVCTFLMALPLILPVLRQLQDPETAK